MANENAKIVTTETTQKSVVVGDKMVTISPSVGTHDSTFKSEFESRIPALEENLQKALVNGQVKLVDSVIYSVKRLGGTTTLELMEAADQREVGLRNINNRKLEANTYMLLAGIQLLEADLEDGDNLALAKWHEIGNIVANGELEIKQADKILYPRSSNEVFRTEGEPNHKLTGYKPLECPKMLIPLTDITPTLWLPNGSAADTEGKAIKVIFHGVRTNG